MTLDEAIDQARRRATDMAMVTTVTLSLDAVQALLAEIDRLRMREKNQPSYSQVLNKLPEANNPPQGWADKVKTK